MNWKEKKSNIWLIEISAFYFSDFIELLVLSFLHKNLKTFTAGIILTFITAFPGGLFLLF